MDRKSFLQQIGLSSAAVFTTACLAACGKSDVAVTPAPTNVDFTIDLTASGSAPLANAGGYIYSQGIIIAKTTAGTYLAVSQVCTHLGVTVIYEGQQQRFYCASHGATFSNTGAVTMGPAMRNLQQYNTAVNGTSLRVFS